MLGSFVKSPFVNIISGFILLFTSSYETWASISDFSVGAHHGILVFSVLHIVRTIPEVIHGLKDISPDVEST